VTELVYGCHECLRPHDETGPVDECPYCGGLTEPLGETPADRLRAAIMGYRPEGWYVQALADVDALELASADTRSST
jgi:hypothetical protein